MILTFTRLTNISLVAIVAGIIGYFIYREITKPSTTTVPIINEVPVIPVVAKQNEPEEQSSIVLPLVIGLLSFVFICFLVAILVARRKTHNEQLDYEEPTPSRTVPTNSSSLSIVPPVPLAVNTPVPANTSSLSIVPPVSLAVNTPVPPWNKFEYEYDPGVPLMKEVTSKLTKQDLNIKRTYSYPPEIIKILDGIQIKFPDVIRTIKDPQARGFGLAFDTSFAIRGLLMDIEKDSDKENKEGIDLLRLFIYIETMVHMGLNKDEQERIFLRILENKDIFKENTEEKMKKILVKLLMIENNASKASKLKSKSMKEIYSILSKRYDSIKLNEIISSMKDEYNKLGPEPPFIFHEMPNLYTKEQEEKWKEHHRNLPDVILYDNHVKRREAIEAKYVPLFEQILTTEGKKQNFDKSHLSKLDYNVVEYIEAKARENEINEERKKL